MSRLEHPDPRARARLLAAAARQTATRPGAWSRRLLGGGALAVAWMVVMEAALGIRHDWRDLPARELAVTLVALAGFALIGTSVAMARGETMAGAATERLRAAVVGLPIALGLLIALVDPRGPSTPAGPMSVAHAVPCDLCVGALAVPLIAIGLGITRGLTLARPLLVGACMGLGAATWAHLLVRIHCPLGGAGHALLGHLLPALPLMALGAWALWWLDRRSSANGPTGKNSS